MNTRSRFLVGLLVAILLFAGTVALLRAGFYGWTMFVLLPLLIGGLSAWVFRPDTGARAAKLGALTVFVSTLVLLALGQEGAICILMSLPLAAPLGALAAWLVYRAQSSKLAARGVTMIILLPPAVLTWDTSASPPVFEVHSRVEIAASPAQVWKHILTLSELPEPQEWFFRAGLAYPREARIEGSGLSATRYCDFSTGPVVEPIEIWDEPRL